MVNDITQVFAVTFKDSEFILKACYATQFTELCHFFFLIVIFFI